ncbi:MAG: hypothetical protein UT48_C0010G0052 [Parcubacteria group bacterium GW2011_GWE2_39_37]|nr:MAG: hypothetical protein UT48_C0010G0052 [Parcubacteria group bacterium GW2011_GWE2_39_37]
MFSLLLVKGCGLLSGFPPCSFINPISPLTSSKLGGNQKMVSPTTVTKIYKSNINIK